VAVLLLTGCAATEDATYLTPVPEETLSAYIWHKPVKTKLDAVIVAQLKIRTSAMVEAAPPQAIYVGESSWNEAMNVLRNTGGVVYEDSPTDERVWLVIFRGTWRIYGPPGPSGTVQPEAREGCAHALFTAAEGRSISLGGAKCPPPDQMPP
jgi:hypothetical protein